MGKRKTTKYPGVQSRESSERRFRGRPDVCFTIDYKDAFGKRVRKDVGWASQGFTAALAAEMRARLVNEAKTTATLGELAVRPKAPIPTFGNAWEKYKCDWLIAKGKHYKSSEALVKNHLQKILSLPLNHITPLVIDEIMAEMRRKGRAIQTIRLAVALIRSVMRKMVAWRLYSGPLPFDEISLPRPNNARERYLTPQEAMALLEELKRRSRQTWLMALISLHCGLRFGEIAAMRWEHVQVDNMTIYIPESKSGRARHAVMTTDVKEALLATPRDVKTSLVFPARGGGIMKAVSDSFVRAVDALGLNDSGETKKFPGGAVVSVKIKDRRQRVVFHTLRHTYASWLARGGQDQLTIADRLGHHSLQMTMRYTHLMDETRRESAEAISRVFHGQPPESQS